MSDVRFLHRYTADQNQYMVINHRSGQKDHVRGPAAFFMDPVLHESVKVQQAVSLNGNEAIVVYRELDSPAAVAASGHPPVAGGGAALDSALAKTGGSAPSAPPAVVNHSGGNIERRTLKGPTLFIPTANEWVHSFSWHGAKPDDKTCFAPNQHRFTKLTTLADQFYYNVRDVRTSDDAQIVVKLMIFFKLSDIETMLDTTNDPHGDFINASCADVISFAGRSTFEQFLGRSSELNELKSFPTLVARAAGIGYNVHKVVYRGYKASEHLEAMHHAANRKRTELTIQARAAEQEETLEDLKLHRAVERGTKERGMAAATQDHALELAAREHTQRLRQFGETARAEQAARAAEQEQDLQYLGTLAEKGVDLTEYLCAKEQGKSSAKVLRIHNTGGAAGGGGGNGPHIHVSE